MFTQENLQELLDFELEQGSAGVLSLYLDTDVATHSIEKIRLELKGLLKEAGPEFSEDVEAIERYFDYSYDWSTPGVAVFSCRAQDFFRAYPVAVAFRNRLRIRNKPFVKHLVHLLDHYAHYGVILIDSVGARFFEYHLGELRETAGTMGEDVRKGKRGSGSSVMGMRGGQGDRDDETQVMRNMRDAAEEAARFFNRRPIRRLFIGGTPANVAQFRELLPRRLQSCYAGTFPIDMDASEAQVREQSLALLRKINADREEKLVQKMVTAAAAGGPAVVGLGPTLRMISDGRVDTLVISDGFRAPGYLHSSGYLSASTDEELFSDNGFHPVEDIVEEAVTRTLEQSGRVEYISDNSDLESAGRIGAILRY